MAQGKVHKTPTGYGVIKIAARKQVVLPKINAPVFVHPREQTATRQSTSRGNSAQSSTL
jgi:hypothetical protein